MTTPSEAALSDHFKPLPPGSSEEAKKEYLKDVRQKIALYENQHQLLWAQKMDTSECAHHLSVLRRCLIAHLLFEVQLTMVEGSLTPTTARGESARKQWEEKQMEADSLKVNFERVVDQVKALKITKVQLTEALEDER
eukprot:9481794-Pyramimonas_sp.AAC.1